MKFRIIKSVTLQFKMLTARLTTWIKYTQIGILLFSLILILSKTKILNLVSNMPVGFSMIALNLIKDI